MKVFLSLLLVILAILGIFDASYLTYEKLTGQIPNCGTGFDCGEVLSSPWATIGPIPLSVFGLLYYTGVLVIAVIHFLELDSEAVAIKVSQQMGIRLKETFRSHFQPHRLILYMTTFGFFFSLYLLGIMAFVIQAWCLYCLGSAAICISLFLTAVALNKITLAYQSHE